MADNQDPSSKSPNKLSGAINPLDKINESLIKELESSFQAVPSYKLTGRKLDEKINSIRKRASSQMATMSTPKNIQAIISSTVNRDDSYREAAKADRELMMTSTSGLQRMLAQEEDRLAAYQKKLSKSAINVQYNPDKPDNISGSPYLQENMQRSGGALGRAATIKAAIIEQNKLGQSSAKEESLYENLTARTSAVKEKKELKDSLKKLGSYAQEEAKLNTTQTQFEAAYGKRLSTQQDLEIKQSQKAYLEKQKEEAESEYLKRPDEDRKKVLDEANKQLENFAAELEDAAKKADEASKGFEKTGKELKAQQARAAAAQDAGGGAGRFGRGLTVAGQAGGILANELQYGLVDQKLRAQQVKSSIAQYNLKQYDRAFAATQGDVASMYEVFMADKTGKLANSIYNTQMGTKGVRELAKGAENVGNLVTGLVPGSIDANKIMGGLGGLVGQVTRNVGDVTDYQLEAAEKQMTAIELQEQHNKAIAALKAKGGQRIHDQFMGALGAVVGSGSSALEAQLTDTASLGNALKTGNLSPSELISLSTQVNQSVKGSGHDRYGIAVRAGEMEKKGVMSAGQYIQAMSAQAGIGGTQGGLESNLRRAFAAGINDSKLLTEFVEMNASLNNNLADIGIALETNNVFANKVKELRDAGVSETLASRAAANSMSKIGNFLTNPGMGPGAMAKSAVLQEEFQKATGRAPTDIEIAALMHADSSQLQTILGEGTLTEEDQRSLSAGKRSVYRAMRSVGKGARKQMRTGANRAVKSGIEADFGMQSDLGSELMNISVRDMSNPINLEEAAEAAATGVETKGQQMKGVAAGAQFKEYQEAAAAFGSAAKAFETMTGAMKTISESISAEKTVKDTQKQAQEMKAEVFGTHVDTFGKWVEALVTSKIPQADPAKAAKANNEEPKKNTGNSGRARYQ